MKKNKPGKIPQCNFRLIDGRENRGQACRQGMVATSKPPLNNQLPVDLTIPEVDLQIVIGHSWAENPMSYYQNVRKDGIQIWKMA